jgi:hypothetical protein
VTTIQDVIYGDTHISRIEPESFGLELDLAMCFFWSNSVNAPGKAKKVLELAFHESRYKEDLVRNLIRGLGDTKFARWDDDLKNGRYQRTRRWMQKLALWPEEFFEDDGIMPKDLV